MSNIDFLTADFIKLPSNAELTFSQGNTTDLKKEFGSQTDTTLVLENC